MSASVTVPGNLIIISSPSGGGKTSLVQALVDKHPKLKISVSHTTRAKREGEIAGEHYVFISETKFQTLLQSQAFVEYAEVFGNWYGTSRKWIEQTLKSGSDILLDIDWQGAGQIKKQYPDAIGIFLLPPSRESLKQRLTARKQDSADMIQKRLLEAQSDMMHYHDYDYVVVNDVFEQALQDIESIIQASKLRCAHQKQALMGLFKKLNI